MSGVDELWAWLYPAIQQLRSSAVNDPGLGWDERRAAFLGWLGLREAGESAAVDLLLRGLDELSDADRATLLAGDEWDAVAYEAVQQAAEDEFGWVGDEARTVLEGWWGSDWRTSLSQDLDLRWGAGWQAHPDEHKTAWLHELIEAPAAAEEPEPAGPSREALLAEFADAMHGVPGFNQLSEEQVAAMIAKALQKMGR
jgi:hypothetical protein